MNPFPCLNPPSQEAMLQALTILQNSIHYENGTVPLKDPHSNQCHSQLDYHITAIEAAFAAFKSRSDLHVADLKRYRNTLSPIHRLPNELLSSILLLSIDPRAYTLASLQKLGRVCKAWRAIVGNTPDFWTRIDFTAPPHVLRLFLQKSKNAGLNIECTVSATDSVLPSKVEDFIEMTHKYASRWTSFKYRGNATQRIMRNIESAGKEKLTELSVHYLWHYRQSWLFNLPKDAPLERISLTSASLDWTTAQLSNLKSLELKDLHMNPPELRTMVQILNASPRMEYLVLMGIVLDADDAARSASDGLLEGDEIRLDDLRSLLLKNVPPHFYTCFLNRIVAPRCQSLIVDAVPPTLFTVPSTSSDAQPARLFDLAKPIIRAAPKLSVSAHGRLNHIQFVTSPEPSEFPSVANAIPGLDLTFETDVPMADLERVARFVGAALAPPVLPAADDDDDQGVQDIEQLLRTQVTLKVGKTWWWDDDQDILVFPPAVLQALHPYLVHLELGRGVDGTEAIQWLSRPLDAMAHTWYDALLEVIRGPYPHHEDEGDLFPCPRLSKVFLKAWSGDSDSIIPFLTNRWRQHGEDGYSSSGSSSRGTGTGTSASSSSRHSSPGVGHGSPVKLEELTLPNLVPVELKELYAQGFWKSSRGYRHRRPVVHYQCPI